MAILFRDHHYNVHIRHHCYQEARDEARRQRRYSRLTIAEIPDPAQPKAQPTTNPPTKGFA